MNAAIPITIMSQQARVDDATWQSKIYRAVVTPVNFVTFLLSLYLIDNHYRAQRSADGNDGRPWLHRLLYRQQHYSPYDHIGDHQRCSSSTSSSQSTNVTLRQGVGEKGEVEVELTKSVKRTDGTWFYHTKQKKLFKLEAADAFAIRRWVFFGLSILIVSAGWLLWQTAVRLTALGWDWVAPQFSPDQSL